MHDPYYFRNQYRGWHELLAAPKMIAIDEKCFVWETAWKSSALRSRACNRIRIAHGNFSGEKCNPSKVETCENSRKLKKEVAIGAANAREMENEARAAAQGTGNGQSLASAMGRTQSSESFAKFLH